MIGIRAITFFEGNSKNTLDLKSILNKDAVMSKISQTGFDTRTLRYTLSPYYLSNFSDFDEELSILSGRLRTLEDLGFRWVNQPFLSEGLGISGTDPVLEHALKYLLIKEQRLFSSISINKVNDIKESSKLYAKVCKSISRSDISGFSNFRFGLGANINNGTPYYPFASSNNCGFSVAVESLESVTSAWEKRGSFDDISEVLFSELKNLQNTMQKLSTDIGIPFFGMDWSLAPLPNSDMSVCSLIEKISNTPIGSPGCLAAIENLTDAIKKPINSLDSVGFNGVMLSVMEDDLLAERFSSGHITINELLLYSTVCGCGLDMIPLSGSESEKSISQISKDVGYLAFRLSKPLGVRFLPIDSMSSGEETSFAHDFVTNTTVSNLR